jgi:hypothetical protein
MATTLPTLTRILDDQFTHTWNEIRPEAIDNILDATPVWAALKAAGCFKVQIGGDYISRTLKYGEIDAVAVQKGDTLPMGEPALETMAMWTWRYLATHVQRAQIGANSDQSNAGPSKIKDYVQTKLMAAREGMVQKFETRLLAPEVTAETGKEIQGLNDLVPEYANRATGTYGRVARSNDWWVPKYKAVTVPSEVHLLADMRNLYNTIGDNMEMPNFLLTTQDMFELYEEFAEDKTQVVKDVAGRLVDLGFEVLRYKGKPLVWSPNMTAGSMLMLNTNYIEVIYDPNLWFEMSDWKPVAMQSERITHILCAINVISTQLRRHGRLYTA